jgi:transposase InsO family protein
MGEIPTRYQHQCAAGSLVAPQVQVEKEGKKFNMHQKSAGHGKSKLVKKFKGKIHRALMAKVAEVKDDIAAKDEKEEEEDEDEENINKSKNFKVKKIEKLNDENYSTWIVDMEMVLDDLGLWLETNEGIPVKGKMSWKALMYSIEKSQFVYAQTPRCGQTAWLALQKQHEKSGMSGRLLTLRNLLTLKWTDGSIDEHTSLLLNTHRKLQRIGIDMPNDIIVAILLNSLPSEYDPLIMALDAIGEESLKLDNIISKLKNTKITDEENGNSALNVKTEEKGKKKFKGKCYKCGKTGHFKKDCYSKRSESALMVKMKSSDEFNDQWVIDSGASTHLTGHLENLINIRKAPPVTVTIPDGGSFKGKKVGDAIISKDLVLKNVYYVPGLETNLISVGKLTDKVSFDKKRCTIGATKINMDKHGLFVIKANNARMLHEKLGHKRIDKKVNFECKTCILANLKRTAKPRVKTRQVTTEVGELLHADIFGPTGTSFDKCRYFLVVIDDYSGYVAVKPIFQKSQATAKIVEIIEEMERQLIIRVKTIRTDNGKEFLNNQLKGYLSRCGIIHEKTTPYSSFQNGKAERYIGLISEKVRVLLLSSGLNEKYWSLAVQHAALVLNVSVGKDGKTPFDKFWKGRRIFDFTRLHRFGDCIAFVNLGAKKSKFSPRALQGKYVGYDNRRKGIKVLVGEKIKYTRDFRLIGNEEENYVSEDESSEESSDEDMGEYFESRKEKEEMLDEYMCESFETYKEKEEIVDDDVADAITQNCSIQECLVREGEMSSKRPDISKVKPNTIIKIDGRVYRTTKNPNIVKTTTGAKVVYNDIGKEAKANYWTPKNSRRRQANAATIILSESKKLENPEIIEARIKEWKAINDNDTFHLVNRSSDQNILPCKFVDVEKVDNMGNTFIKSRLVAGGHRQEYGKDFTEVFAPVVKSQIIRLFLAIATKLDLEVRQIDFDTAFLNSDLKEEVYMAQPKMFEDGTDRVCKLRKGLYGLVQSPKAWNDKVCKFFGDLGFKPLKTDPSVFVCSKYLENWIIVTLYVDDCLLISPNEKDLLKLENDIANRFKIKKLGECKRIIGLDWKRNRVEKSSVITQKSYTNMLIEKFLEEGIKTSTVPMAIYADEDKSALFEKHKLFMQAVGSLIYLAVNSRPDISYAVSRVSRKLVNPSQQDWNDVKRILRYLKGNVGFGIKYGSSSNGLEAYADASYGTEKDRKSRSGFAVYMAGGAIGWYSKMQRVVALSTLESEYIAAATCAQDLMFYKQVIQELGIKEIEDVCLPVRLHMDNQGAIAVSKHVSNHDRSKHIDIRYHYLRDLVNKEEVVIDYCETKKMTADTLTKPLSKELFEKHRSGLGLINLRGSVGFNQDRLN